MSVPTKIILVYHGIGTSNKLMEVSDVDFKKQINYLIDQGFIFLGVDHLLQAKVKSVVLVFDDGLGSVMKVKDFLERKNIFFGLSLIVEKIYGNDRKYLNSEQLLSFKKCDFYSHGYNHCDLTSLSEEALKYELDASKNYLETQFNKKVATIVYPFGKYNREVLTTAKKIGYQQGLSLLPFHLSSKPEHMLLPRLNINGFVTFTKFKFFVSKIGNLYLHFSFLLKKYIRKDYLTVKEKNKNV